MHAYRRFLVIGIIAAVAMTPAVILAATPPGIVYESEAVAKPDSAWKKNRRTADHWNLWTEEEDIDKKRSGGASLASPTVEADRESPEEGAPALHCVVDDLKPGVYLAYVSSPGRPLGYSLDGERWFRHAGTELFLGMHELPEGRFEFWVDDRYANPPGNAGSGYFDYVRFVGVSATAMNVRRCDPIRRLEYDLRTGKRGFAVPASELTLEGFEVEGGRGGRIEGRKTGDSFSYTFDRQGTFYPAVEMVDSRSAIEELSVTFEGGEIGRIVAGHLDGRPALFCLQEPVAVEPGDRLVFTCKSDVDACLVSKVYFSTQVIEPPPARFENVAHWSPEPGVVDFCWTTNRGLATGHVEYGIDSLGESTEPSGYIGRNHRVRLSGLDPLRAYQARLVSEHDGASLVSEVICLHPVPVTPPPTKRFSVELTVPEPTEHARKNWPAKVGIPFAKGALGKLEDLRLFGAADRPELLQADLFSRWADGSVKWATIGFMAETRPGDAASSYRLEARPAWDNPAPRGSDVVSSAGTEGLWELLVGGFNLHLRGGDGELLIGKPPESDAPRVEINGPIRAVVKWSGPIVDTAGKRRFAYLVRMELWQDRPAIGLDISVLNDQPSPRFQSVGSVVLRIPWQSAGELRGGFDNGPLETVSVDRRLAILQDRDDHYRIQTGDRTVDGERSQGVAVIQDDRMRLLAVMPNFWQTYPKGYAVGEAGLDVQVLPPLATDTYTREADGADFSRLYAWQKDGNYSFRSGQLLRQRLLVRFDATGRGDATERTSAWMANPLLPRATSEYLTATGVLGRRLFPRTEGVWNDYEKYFEKSFANHLEDRRRGRTYGWMHFGDWYGERSLNFGNNEYDLNWGLGVQWMRTGDRRYFDRGLEMARHYASVDTLHGDFTDSMNGLAWTHSFNHVGTDRTPEELGLPGDDGSAKAYLERYGRGMFRGSIDRQGHIYQEGNWLFAALSGDPFLRDVAQRVSTNQAERLTPDFNFGIERSGGWPLVNAVAAYRFSGDPYYLNAARLMIERCLERQDPATGGWPHWPPVSETGDVRVFGGKAFAVGILSYGILRYLDEEPLERAEVREMLVGGADWLMNESWTPGKGFRYISNSPIHRGTGGRGVTCLLNAEIIAFAYRETGDPKYLDFWKEMMQGAFDGEIKGIGKNFAMGIHQVVFGLDRVRSDGIVASPDGSADK